MKFNDYLENIRKSSTFRTLIPINQGVIYPIFSFRNGELCASFLAHRTETQKDELKIYFPEFYMTFTCPKGVLLNFERIAFNPKFTKEELGSLEVMPKLSAQETLRKREEFENILRLGDKILTEWDMAKTADVDEYNSAYLKIITENQRKIFEKL